MQTFHLIVFIQGVLPIVILKFYTFVYYMSLNFKISRQGTYLALLEKGDRLCQLTCWPRSYRTATQTASFAQTIRCLEMVKEHSVSTCYHAIGMIEAGATQAHVTKTLMVAVRTIWNWKNRHEAGETLENRPGRGRKKSISRIAKIVISKSMEKRRHSTRSLAKCLTAAGHLISHTSIHMYLRCSLNARPFKPRRTPKSTPAQVTKRIRWCKERKLWGEWRRVIFSDKSPFELFHSPNVQNDRVWVRNGEDVDPLTTVKFPTKIMVWGAMSSCALTELHIVPVKRLWLPSITCLRSSRSCFCQQFVVLVPRALPWRRNSCQRCLKQFLRKMEPQVTLLSWLNDGSNRMSTPFGRKTNGLGTLGT